MKLKIYNVLWKDRHADITAKPFLSLEEAIAYARESARSVARFPEDYKETKVHGWLLHIVYSCEGDSIWITEHDINYKDKKHAKNTIQTQEFPTDFS